MVYGSADPCFALSDKKIKLHILSDPKNKIGISEIFRSRRSIIIAPIINQEWYHDCCRKIPKKYFTNEALDYFCSKVCQIESDKSMSLSY